MVVLAPTARRVRRRVALRTPRPHRGAAAITLMLLLLSLAAMLGLVEVGYLYWSKRDLQKTADLSALAGAQRLDHCSAANDDNLAARGNAVGDNAFTGTLEIACGHWSPTTPGTQRFVAPGPDQVVNAVRVVARRAALPLFGQLPAMPQLSAMAIARRAPPQAAFSAGARLLNVNDAAPLQRVLRLVGVDLSDTQVASYTGLAKLQITPRGLLQALGLEVAADIGGGELNRLLNVNTVRLGQLLDLMVSLAGQQQRAGVDLSLLRTRLAQAGLEQVAIRLGSDSGASGLFAELVAPDGDAGNALDVQLNALDLLGTAIGIAGGRNAVDVAGLNLLGVQAQAAIVEPASLGIGPVGTTAYNAQVRLRLDIDSDRLLLVGSLIRLLGTRVRLPVYIDVVDGFARLAAIDCTGQPRRASFDVTSSVANVCIGKAVTDWRSTQDLCTATGSLADEQLLTLFGSNMLSTHMALPALAARQRIDVAEGETGSVAPNPLEVGTLVADLTAILFDSVARLFDPAASEASTATTVATRYLEATKNAGTGRYSATAVIDALRNGSGDLGALGTWTARIPQCNLLYCSAVDGDVWKGFLDSTQIGGSLLGTVLDVLGISACDGLLSQLLNYNNCVRNNLAHYLQTKPGGLDSPAYDPRTGSQCSGALCLLLRPLVDGTLRPLLNGLGTLLGSTLDQVLGLQLGRTDVHVSALQCRAAQLVF